MEGFLHSMIEQHKYTISEASEHLSVNPGFVYRLIHTGKLRCIRGFISCLEIDKYKTIRGKA